MKAIIALFIIIGQSYPAESIPHIVVPGDSWSKLCRNYYGVDHESLLKRLSAVNGFKGIANKDNFPMPDGKTFLLMPPLEVLDPRWKIYESKKGDTIREIASNNQVRMKDVFFLGGCGNEENKNNVDANLFVGAKAAIPNVNNANHLTFIWDFDDGEWEDISLKFYGENGHGNELEAYNKSFPPLRGHVNIPKIEQLKSPHTTYIWKNGDDYDGIMRTYDIVMRQVFPVGFKNLNLVAPGNWLILRNARRVSR